MRGSLRAASLPQPLCNAPVERYSVDFLWPEQQARRRGRRLPVPWPPKAFERDRRKDQTLIAAGYRVLRVTWLQLETSRWPWRRRLPPRSPPAALRLASACVRVLLTNDDGIEAAGLQALRKALLRLPGVELAVIAPDGNRSAMARSITTRRPLWVEEVEFGDGTVGLRDRRHAGRLRAAGPPRVDRGLRAELVVSGINHGSNLGDDITYSGTVAAALEAIVLGLPGIAVSQQSSALELDFRQGRASISRSRRRSQRGWRGSSKAAAAARDAAQHQRAGRAPGGVEVARLGKRVYRDELALIEEELESAGCTGSTATRAMSADETGTDLAAVAQGKIAVTPIHFDLTDREGLDALQRHDLARLIAPAASEV